MAGRGEFGVRYTHRASTLDSEMARVQPFAAPGPDLGLSYEELSNRVASSVTQINSNMASLQRLVKQSSRAAPNSRFHAQLSTVQKTTTELIKTTNENMHRLESVPTGTMSSSAKKRHNLHLERIRTSFKEAVSKFNSVTKALLDKERDAVSEARRNVSLTRGGLHDEDEEEDNVELSVEDERLLNSSRQLAEQQQQDEADFRAVREREAALRELESDILDVNDIFRDLSQMVHEQGTTVDLIESNIDAAAIDVEAANGEIVVAARYQKKARTKVCLVVGVIVAIAGIIALIVVLSNVHSS